MLSSDWISGSRKPVREHLALSVCQKSVQILSWIPRLFSIFVSRIPRKQQNSLPVHCNVYAGEKYQRSTARGGYERATVQSDIAGNRRKPKHHTDCRQKW